MKKLEEVARWEVEAARKALGAKIPEDFPVTIQLYQPDCPYRTASSPGCLIDVGPQQEDSEIVLQDVSAGSTGKFMHDSSYAMKFIPSEHLLTEDDIASYRNAPHAERLAQVRLESRRYRSLEWQHSDRPPLNACIYHLSLSPPVKSLYVDRLPSIGVVYTMTPKPSESDAYVQRLIHVSQLSAAELLRNRALFLLGDRLEKLRGLYQHPDFLPSEDDLYKLATAFLLSHHWFYPYSPLAYALLLQLSRSEEQVQNAYKWHQWGSPRLVKGAPTDDQNKIFSDLAKDLAQVGAHALGVSLEVPLHTVGKRLEKYILTAACHLAQDVAVLFKRFDQWDVSFKSPQSSDVVCLFPRQLQIHEAPIYLQGWEKDWLTDAIRAQKISQKARTYRRECFEQASPGQPKSYGSARAHRKPTAVVTKVSILQKKTSILCSDELSHNNHHPPKWLRHHARFLLERIVIGANHVAYGS